MTRRRATPQQAAGDDSFLDIVANIVGILIILIVVAGVRASRAPIEFPETVAGSDEPEPPPTEVVTPPRLANPLRVTAPEITDRTDEVTRLSDESEEIRVRLDETLKTLSAVRRRAAERHEQITSVRKEQADRRPDVGALSIQVKAARGAVKALEREQKQARLLLQKLVATPTDEVVNVPHRLTPVGRSVRGAEQHFHVRNGRVVLIPLDRLKQRVRDQMARYGRMMSRFRKHEGQVGPVEGFVMEYTVERLPVEVVDELRRGRGMIRIGVTRWTIQPEPDLESEPIEVALSSSSRYQTVLRACGPETALTFWVYPDSFSEVRRLQAAAHKAGFRVAARPLPPGVTISGSPDGTRSQAQ